jgi:hypothetical protein
MLALLAALLVGSPDPVAADNEAKVAIVQGLVEGKLPAEADFKGLKPGDAVNAGVTLRTGANTRVAIDFADGSELRISDNTELVVTDARALDLKKGRIQVRVAKGPKKLEVETPHVHFTADKAVVDITFTPRVQDGPPAGTTIQVLEGVALAASKKFKANVYAGFWCTALGTQLNTPDPLRNGSLDTAWVHPLLAERGRADEEVSNRMMELTGILANVKLNDPVEAAIRPLGDLATPELARYLGRPLHPVQADRRLASARIIAETGTVKSAAALATLLQHSEPEVRVIAARGLARLNGGKDLGFGDAVWKGESLAAGQKAWEDWVKQNSK